MQPAPALEAALRHHLRALDSGARLPEPSRTFLRDAPEEPIWAGLSLSDADGSVTALESEAARRRIALDRMLTHAFFAYLSALDSGELD